MVHVLSLDNYVEVFGQKESLSVRQGEQSVVVESGVQCLYPDRVDVSVENDEELLVLGTVFFQQKIALAEELDENPVLEFVAIFVEVTKEVLFADDFWVEYNAVHFNRLLFEPLQIHLNYGALSGERRTNETHPQLLLQ